MPASISQPESGADLPAFTGRIGKYLLFRLAQGEFGIAIHKVREVTEIKGLTSVAHAPNFIAGVINLRGRAVPVIDLRLTFGLAAADPTPETCIMLARVALASAERVVGFLVDAIMEVRTLKAADLLKPEDFRPLSEPGTFNPTPYLLGVARLDGKIKLLLDLDEVLNNLDLRQVPVLSPAV